MQRLAQLADGPATSGTFGQVLDLWDQVIRLDWPPSSRFPAHFSERVGAMAGAESRGSRLWLDRLNKAHLLFAGQPGCDAHPPSSRPNWHESKIGSAVWDRVVECPAVKNRGASVQNVAKRAVRSYGGSDGERPRRFCGSHRVRPAGGSGWRLTRCSTGTAAGSPDG